MALNTENILKELVSNKSLIKYHKNWGFYIETKFDAIHMIGLIPKEDYIELSLYYGDTQTQSRAFYNKNVKLEHLLDSKWDVSPNFHFSSTHRNLIWFDSKLSPEQYFKFWKENINLLYQHSIKDLPELVNKLVNAGIVLLDKEREEELETLIYDKGYTLINICAGFGATYRINNTEAEELNKKGLLSNFLINKINEGLSIIGEKGNNFLLDLYKGNEKGDPDGL